MPEPTHLITMLIKGPLLGLRQFLAAESPLQMVINAFYSILNSFFVLKTFNFLRCLFSRVVKRLDKKG